MSEESPTGTTSFAVQTRVYRKGDVYLGLAQLVTAERLSGDVPWTRMGWAVYWWPSHEDREWPNTVEAPDGPEIFIACDRGDGPDPWQWFEERLSIDHRYERVDLPAETFAIGPRPG